MDALRPQGEGFSYYSNVRKEILPFLALKPGMRVLDVGCGTGATGALIRGLQPDAHLTGLELDPDVAKQARELYQEVHVLNLDLANELPVPDRSFDLILCLDVLEHLRDPWSTLEKIARRLNRDGMILVGLPNVRHLKVTLPLVFGGRWDYDPTGGLLDRTHLRFFTRKTALALVSGSGLQVTGYRHTGMAPWCKTWFANLLTLGLLKEWLQAGFLVQARKR